MSYSHLEANNSTVIHIIIAKQNLNSVAEMHKISQTSQQTSQSNTSKRYSQAC